MLETWGLLEVTKIQWWSSHLKKRPQRAPSYVPPCKRYDLGTRKRAPTWHQICCCPDLGFPASTVRNALLLFTSYLVSGMTGLAQLKEHMTPDLGFMSSTPTLGIEINNKTHPPTWSRLSIICSLRFCGSSLNRLRKYVHIHTCKQTKMLTENTLSIIWSYYHP